MDTVKWKTDSELKNNNNRKKKHTQMEKKNQDEKRKSCFSFYQSG